MKTDPYLQFPLSILKTFPLSALDVRPHRGIDTAAAVSRLFAYGAIRNGQRLWWKLYGNYEPEDGSLSDKRQEALDDFAHLSRSDPSWPSDFDETNELHRAAATFFRHLDIAPFVPFEEITTLYGGQVALLSMLKVDLTRSPMVRLRIDLLEDWRRGKLKHFDTMGFCAIQSILGTNSFYRITRDEIAPRMLGYPSRKAFEENAPKELHERLPHTKRISRMIQKLQNRGLIQVVRPNKRENYFSVSRSNDSLREAVKNHKLNQITKSYSNQKQDQELQQLLRDQRKAVKRSFSKDPNHSGETKSDRYESDLVQSLAMQMNQRN